MPRGETYKKLAKKANPKKQRKRQHTYSLILLTLNEIDGVKALWKHIPRKEVNEILAVDGGSTDGTLEFYKKNKVKVVKQKSRGRGEAFRLAVKYAKGDVLIFFSPDGNEDPADIPRFIPFFELGADMVIADRMMRGAINEEDDQFFRWRKWANQTFTLIANILWRKPKQSFVSDTINGYRAIRRELFSELKPDAAGYAIEYQMSIRAMKLGKDIVKFPTQEGSRIGGESYAKSLPTGFKFLGLLWKEIWRGKRF